MPFPYSKAPSSALAPGYRLMDGNDILYMLNGKTNFSAISLTGFFAESTSDTLTANAGGGQTNALPLAAELNRVSTVATAGDSVMLPASVAGLTIVVENAGSNPMQVFGSGTDTVNNVVTATGVSQMAGSVVIYTCYTAGAWFAANIGAGYSGSLQTMSYNPASLTAHAGGGQGSATPLLYMQNMVSVVATTGDSVVLPASAPGLQISVINQGANSCNVFCPSGSTMNGTSNGSSALAASSVGIYFCVSATAWLSK